MNGTQLALAFLKPPGAFCVCRDWYRKHHCPSSEWMLWQHRVNSPFYSQLVGILSLWSLNSHWTLSVKPCSFVTSCKLAVSPAFHQPLDRQLCWHAHLSESCPMGVNYRREWKENEYRIDWPLHLFKERKGAMLQTTRHLTCRVSAWCVSSANSCQ